MRQRLKITRDTSIVAGMVPVVRVSNGIGDANTAVYNMDHTSLKKSSIPQTAGLYTSVAADKLESTISIDSKPKSLEFTPRFMHRFHWITQMSFFFGFVIFCLFYFLVYPNIHSTLVDDDCDRNAAEWFAEIR